MKNKVYQNFDEAVADIPDGITFMSPGFGGVGVPRNLLAALTGKGPKDLPASLTMLETWTTRWM